MKRVAIVFAIIAIGFLSCKLDKEEKVKLESPKFTKVVHEDYELYKPNKAIKAVLVLFGGFGEDAEGIRREFKILELARENDIAVVLSNYNQKLWLEEDEKHELANTLQGIIEEHQLPIDNIFIGGFSSGGVVSLLMSDFIAGIKQYNIKSQGVFVVDSPVDLSGVYQYCEKSIERDFSDVAVREAVYLKELLENHLGNPKDDIEEYKNHSVFTLSTNNTIHLGNLKNTKIRFYAEPDTIWWKENRMMEYKELNAFYLSELCSSLKDKGFQSVEYLATKDKGYKADGTRHPHSWSIVDKLNLVNWILNK